MNTTPYFPFFVSLDRKEGLVVGGQSVALRKILKLLPYGPRIEVCAPEICQPIRDIPGLRLLHKPFAPALLKGKAFVVAATNKKNVNAEISHLCEERRIPVNVVDDPELCTFLFPALVQTGTLSIGVCTGGASPAAAALLRREIEDMLPANIDQLLDWMEDQRGVARAALGTVDARRKYLREACRAALEKRRPLTPQEVQEMLRGHAEEQGADG